MILYCTQCEVIIGSLAVRTEHSSSLVPPAVNEDTLMSCLQGNLTTVMVVQFSSVHFDLITQEMLHLQLIGGFHAGPGPH